MKNTVKIYRGFSRVFHSEGPALVSPGNGPRYLGWFGLTEACAGRWCTFHFHWRKKKKNRIGTQTHTHSKPPVQTSNTSLIRAGSQGSRSPVLRLLPQLCSLVTCTLGVHVRSGHHGSPSIAPSEGRRTQDISYRTIHYMLSSYTFGFKFSVWIFLMFFYVHRI